ncbi:MAG: hypothetical protein V2B18_16935 [Pseudomonadota bacterium]
MTIALYSLMMKEALDFFETIADEDYWNNLAQAERDAILVTYCVMGAKQIHNKYLADKAKWDAAQESKPEEERT